MPLARRPGRKAPTSSTEPACPRQPPFVDTPGRIRTVTVLVLSEATPAFGLQGRVYNSFKSGPGESRTLTSRGHQLLRLARLPLLHWPVLNFLLALSSSSSLLLSASCPGQQRIRRRTP